MDVQVWKYDPIARERERKRERERAKGRDRDREIDMQKSGSVLNAMRIHENKQLSDQSRK
eukprot:SAG31_NODE_1447_length_8308_cov_58.914881_2_plen_60_part_00